MRFGSNSWVWLVAGIVVGVAVGGPIQPAAASCVGEKASVIADSALGFRRSGGSSQVLISLKNGSDTGLAQAVRVIVRVGDSSAEERIDGLQPGSATVVELLVLHKVGAASARVEYLVGGTACSVVVPIVWQQDPAGRRDAPWYAVGLSGIIGALVAHLLTRSREKRRANLEWGLAIFARYEEAYRLFLAWLPDYPGEQILRVRFEALKEKAVLPKQIRKAYAALMFALDSPAGAPEVAEAVDELRSRIVEFMVRPWGRPPR